VPVTPIFEAGYTLRLIGLCAVFATFPPGMVCAADGNDIGADFFSADRPAAATEDNLSIDILPFWTSDLKKAKDAYKRGDYSEAANRFRKISEEGNIVADWYLGYMYQLGRGVPQDDARAFSYFSRVADAFDPDEPRDTRLRIMIDAIVKVAEYYRTGMVPAGIPQNLDRATTLFKLAASYGHPEAQYWLGMMSLNGKRQRITTGLQWLLSASKKRFAPAEAKLGELYWEGLIVKQDRTRALMWYMLAQETAEPEKDRGILDRYRSLMDQASEEERLEASARAKVWAEQFPVPKPIATRE
jgi:TPR repeat protein